MLNRERNGTVGESICSSAYWSILVQVNYRWMGGGKDIISQSQAGRHHPAWPPVSKGGEMSVNHLSLFQVSVSWSKSSQKLSRYLISKCFWKTIVAKVFALAESPMRDPCLSPLCGFITKQQQKEVGMGGGGAAWHSRAGQRQPYGSVVKAALPVVWPWNRVCRGSQSILVAAFFFWGLFLSPFLPCSGCPTHTHTHTHTYTHTRTHTATPPPAGNSLAVNETALTEGVSWPLKEPHTQAETPAPLHSCRGPQTSHLCNSPPTPLLQAETPSPIPHPTSTLSFLTQPHTCNCCCYTIFWNTHTHTHTHTHTYKKGWSRVDHLL